MKEFQVSDLVSMPNEAVYYGKMFFGLGSITKWIPASLIALFTNINQVFGTLFWIVGILWFCDFIIGIAKAWMEDEKKVEWGKAFKSVIKILVMGVGVLAIHFTEKLILETGVDLQGKLTGAVLIVMGTTEAISVLDNLTYFFPQLDGIAKKIRDLLGKARNQNVSDS